jgi:hypothetical protein
MLDSDFYRSNPNLKKPGIQLEYSKDQIEEYVKCAKDPVYFARTYMKIVHVDRGIIPFDLYDYQEKMIRLFTENRYVITKMPRQSGKSTGVIGFMLHFILFNDNKNVALLANKSDTARNLLDRLKKAYELLPIWLQQGVIIWNKGSIEIENGSKIIATSTTGNSARGDTFSLVFLDEFAHVPHNLADEFFQSVYPTISSGKETKMIIVSTPKGLNYFYKMWREAEQGRSEFKTVEINWWDTPGRDEEWKNKQIENTSEEHFAQEFACNFLGSSNTLISAKKLQELVFVAPILNKNGFKLYEEAKETDNYVIVVDTSRGVGLDNSAFIVTNVSLFPYKIVATFMNPNISPMIYPELIYNVAKKYNDAFVLVEINDNGEQIANALSSDLEYDNILTTRTAGRSGQVLSSGFGTHMQLGVRTTKTVKRIGCATLKDLVENNKLTFEDYDIIEELSNFILKKDSYQADEGHHDDLAMCLVLFSWMARQEYFKELTEIDIRQRIVRERERYIEESVLPYILITDGNEEEIEEIPDHYAINDLKRIYQENGWLN